MTIKQKQLQHFHYLHEHAEISWQEVQTTRYLKDVLTRLGYKVTDFDDCTGLYADFGQGHPIVAVRADIDALWQEVDGRFQANHSCGHDAHMSIVIGVAKRLQQGKFKGTLRLIFQPAEEKGDGALKMVEKGVIDDVEFLYGIHLRPIQEMPFGVASPVIVHGAGYMIDGQIEGDDSHGARPHLTVNAIDMMTMMNEQLHQIRIDPQIPHSIKMTYIRAGGESRNIIPGNGQFGLDLRAQTNEAMQELLQKFKQIIEGVRATTGATIQYKIITAMPAAVQNKEAIALARTGIAEAIGEENIVPTLITSGGDDFHFYTIKRPQLKATMIGLGCDLAPGLHHPNMRFNTDALEIGTNILTKTILATFHAKQ